jgi:methionine synthase II (cobalamin-independent)
VSRLNPPFRADHVGSALRPKEIVEARERCQDGQISEEELRRIEDQSIRDVVRHQEAIGLRSIIAARYMPLENMCLSPQCGFASTVHGNELTQASQWAKLELVVNTAREIWGD